MIKTHITLVSSSTIEIFPSRTDGEHGPLKTLELVLIIDPSKKALLGVTPKITPKFEANIVALLRPRHSMGLSGPNS